MQAPAAPWTPPLAHDSEALSVVALGMDEAIRAAQAWSDLAGRALEPNPFFESAFVGPAARLLARAGDPHVATAWRGSRMVALLPLATPRFGRLAPTLSAWTHDQAVLGSPLLDPDDGRDGFRAILHWLRRRNPAAGGLLLPFVAEEGAAAAAIREACGLDFPLSRLDPHRRAALVGGERFEALLDRGVSAKKRKEFGRLRRRLAEAGALRVSSAETPAEVERASDVFLAMEAKGWKGRSGTAFAASPRGSEFLRGVTRGLAEQGACRIDVLHAGAAPVAAAILLGGRRRALYWKTAYDESFAAFSPGALLTLDVSRRQLDDGVALTDSCAVADHPMIDRIWPDRIAMADWWIALRPTGPALLAMLRARRAARSVAKTALRRLIR
ncbi:GNAT family N-acetyltransferase [Alsobacter sp. KACC 23698]|uniref:GNAT family N-acetyltransferase n=1 Tax=Alsobacter sp. KACC 23698 TaxID=3149229 RepID=A0AAU7JDS9_9HYPH